MKNPFPGFLKIAAISLSALYFTLAGTSCIHADKAPKVVTVKEAFAKVRYRIDVGSFRNYVVYAAEQPLPGGSAIPSWGKNIKVPFRYDLAWFLSI
jgi:hypothetical protein